MGQKCGIEIKKEKVDFKTLKRSSSSNGCNYISKDVDIVCIFPHSLEKTLKEKHCFDRHAGRVPVIL